MGSNGSVNGDTHERITRLEERHESTNDLVHELRQNVEYRFEKVDEKLDRVIAAVHMARGISIAVGATWTVLVVLLGYWLKK